MNDDQLNVVLVERLRREKGVTIRWLSRKLGLSTTGGYVMFRDGLLPKDRPRRREVLGNLAEFLGVGASDLIIPKRALSA